MKFLKIVTEYERHGMSTPNKPEIVEAATTVQALKDIYHSYYPLDEMDKCEKEELNDFTNKDEWIDMISDTIADGGDGIELWEIDNNELKPIMIYDY